MAAVLQRVLMLVLCLELAVGSLRFEDRFQPNWAPDHVMYDGDLIELRLDNSSGCGFASKSKYLFGSVSVQIKLVEGDSAGTVTAFYMSSVGEGHDELDFEFLGNVSGEPYIVQTNIYVNGTGNREQRHYLWFDPTKDFHSYSILWNRHQILFMADNVPIRAFRKQQDTMLQLPFPDSKPMWVYGSVWNADDWATQGGRVKTNWSDAPFVSQFRGFEIDACEVGGMPADQRSDDGATERGRCADAETGFWWDTPAKATLSPHQVRQLKWVSRRYKIYDYCRDAARFVVKPVEC
ncbi:xyloglucan endotransglucosylase protein 6-like [Nymphaea colorata]|nr:xyloglucan endotransglucosylase protein 6-like [Nymphaea colorata]